MYPMASRASWAVWAALGSRGPGGRLMTLPGFYAGCVGSLCVSPHGDVALHHPVALGQLDAAGQRAPEAAERLLVVGAEDQEVVAARTHRLGAELEIAALGERHRAEVVGECDRADLARLPLGPHGALARGRRIVHPGDEVPGHPPAVGRRRADPGRPAPGGVTGVVA